jgi:hypothetical protein
VRFSEHPPSKQWAALKYRGEAFAEVWFMPEGEPCGLTFRIPRESFHIPGISAQLTVENLLRAVAVVPEEIESWRHGDDSHSGMGGPNPDLRSALPPPPPHVTHLEIHVRLSPQPEDAALLASGVGLEGDADTSESVIASANWHDLEARWKAILVLEVTINTIRASMESLLIELDSSLKKPLTIEEKSYGLRADISHWEQTKKRAQFVLPKIRDFIHRSVWAEGSPERKRLEEVYRDHIQPRIRLPELDGVLKRLEDLQKDRQVLAALGKAVQQEARGVAGEVQGALRTLHNNAVANAKRKKGESKNKFLK